MKKAVFFLAFMLLSISYLKAQPYLTINNNTTCTLYVQANLLHPNCTNPFPYVNTALPPGQTIVDGAVLCSCTPTGYIWASARFACFAGTLSLGSPCNNNVFTIGDGSTCNVAAVSACMNVASGCGPCGQVTGTYTPGSGGDAAIDLN